MKALALLALLLVTSAWAGTHCTTYQEKTLGRLYTACDDGTRGLSTYNQPLERWETAVLPPPGTTCTWQLNPSTHQWEGRCR